MPVVILVYELLQLRCSSSSSSAVNYAVGSIVQGCAEGGLFQGFQETPTEIVQQA